MKTQAKSQEPIAIIELYLTKPFQSIDRNITSMIIIDIAFISCQFVFIIIFFFNSIFLLRIFLYIFTSEMYFSIHPLVDVFFFQIFFIFKKSEKKIHPLVNVLENTSHHEDV